MESGFSPAVGRTLQRTCLPRSPTMHSKGRDAHRPLGSENPSVINLITKARECSLRMEKVRKHLFMPLIAQKRLPVTVACTMSKINRKWSNSCAYTMKMALRRWCLGTPMFTELIGIIHWSVYLWTQNSRCIHSQILGGNAVNGSVVANGQKPTILILSLCKKPRFVCESAFCLLFSSWYGGQQTRERWWWNCMSTGILA